MIFINHYKHNSHAKAL